MTGSDESDNLHSDQPTDDHQPHPQAGSHFGEIIPEKNWQDTFLRVISLFVLAGLVWLFSTWMSLPLASAQEKEVPPIAH